MSGLANAKLALLDPQWQKEEQAFREAEKEKQDQTGIAMREDARRAVEFQRQRLLLQRHLDAGKIDRDSFTLQDREALAAIADLRKKYG